MRFMALANCRNLATISSGLYRFLAITVLLDVKNIPQVGPLQWGRIRPGSPSPSSPPAEKATASQDQPGQASTGGRARDADSSTAEPRLIRAQRAALTKAQEVRRSGLHAVTLP